MLTNNPHRLDGVAVTGVDDHARRDTRRGDTYVTVIIDLTPVRDRTGPSTPAGQGFRRVSGGVQDIGSTPRARRSGAGSRSSRWTDSPASKPPPPRPSRTRSPSWTIFHVLALALAGDKDRCRPRSNGPAVTAAGIPANGRAQTAKTALRHIIAVLRAASEAAGRAHPSRAHLEPARRRRARLLRTPRTSNSPTEASTAALSIFVARLSVSANSLTISRNRFSRTADFACSYTRNPDGR